MRAAKQVAVAFLAMGMASVTGQANARPFCTNPPLIPLLPLTGTRSSAVFETHQNVAPGDLACFKLDVPAARTLHVTLASIGDNASFRLYPPGWTIERDGRAFTFGEEARPGASEADRARTFTGPMQAGNTLIVVGMKDGGGQYRLHVEVY